MHIRNACFRNGVIDIYKYITIRISMLKYNIGKGNIYVYKYTEK